VSDASGLPRLLASLLGVEVPVRSAQSPPPPAGARPRIPAPAVDDARARSVRRPLAEGERRDAASPSAAAVDGVRPRVPRPAGATATRGEAVTRRDVLDVLGSTDALRAAVVVAEVLGPPRALRPYGTDLR
jgi:hypothetical protein